MKSKIDRQIETRRELTRLEEEKKTAIKAVEDAPDEVWDAVYNKYASEISRLHSVLFYLDYPEPRNAWFKNFCKSFGKCEARRITYKQAEIFMRYGEHAHYYESGRGTTYYCSVDGIGYKCLVFTEREPAYLYTVKL